MKKIIGRVIPQPKGEYKADYNYNIYDVVQKGAAVYQSRKADNLGNPVTDTEWWTLFYDLGVALEQATSTQMPETGDSTKIARLMAIGTDGQPVSITPAALVNFILENSSEYDLMALSNTSTANETD